MDEPERVTKHALGLLQVNNVNSVALAKDVFLHLRIPAPHLVAELHAGFQKFFHRNRNQTLISFSVNWFNVLTITAGLSQGEQPIRVMAMDLLIADFRFSIVDFRSTCCQIPIGNRQLEPGNVLAFRELEAFAGTLLPILLTFFDSWIARNQTSLLECRAKVGVIFEQGAGDSVTYRARLSGRTAAANIDQNIKLAARVGQLQRLANNHAQRFIRKILIKGFSID